MDTATRLGRVEEHLADLAAAQARTEHAVAALGEGLARLADGLNQLSEAQRRTEEEVRALTLWREGERGRRDGERFEQSTAAKAELLFDGGDGGSPSRDRHVQRWLAAALRPASVDLTAGRLGGADPFNADVIWWKGNRVAVVEVSIVVDEDDVERAMARADTLRDAGSDAFPVVMGERWLDPETRGYAESHLLAWQVGRETNDRFIAFRKLLPTPPPV